MNLFIIQKDTGAKDFWYDFSSSINIQKNEGLYFEKPVHATSNVYFYETVKTKFIIHLLCNI